MLSIRDIFRSSSKISGVNIGAGILAAGANIFVARRLGPDVFGVVGWVQMWLFYAGFAKPGCSQAAYREMLHLLGQSKDEEAHRIQDVALTTDWLFLAAPALAMLCASLFVLKRMDMRLGMAIAAVTFTVTSIYQTVDMVQWVHKRFALITRVNLLTGILQPALLIAGTWLLGLAGALAAPAVSTLLAIGYYVLRTQAFDFSPRWDWRESKKLMVIGFPLVLQGLLYWGMRTSDRTMVAAWLSLAALGYFSFAMSFINQGCQLVSDFVNVLQSHVFSELGRLGRVAPLSGKIQRICLLVTLATGCASGLAQAGFHPFVAMLAPKFTPGVKAFEILALNLVCTTISLPINTILNSAVMNRQNLTNGIQVAGLILNVAVGRAFYLLGWGLNGIAWSSAVSQLAVAVAIYAAAHRALFEEDAANSAVRFYSWGLGLIGLTFAMHWTMDRSIFGYAAEGSWLFPFVARILLLSIAWSLTAVLVHRYWWPERSLKRLLA